MFGGKIKGAADKAAPGLKTTNKAERQIELGDVRATIYMEDGEITRYSVQARSPGSTYWDGLNIAAHTLPELQQVINELSKEVEHERD